MSGDHPRVRGELEAAGVAVTSGAGSPPRTRGAGTTSAGPVHGPRITPAYAGSCGAPGQCRAARRDHPRVRGELGGGVGGFQRGQGSPPRTRGADVNVSGLTSAARITPAYAGSCPHLGVGYRAASDHPRVRGELGAFSALAPAGSGSPPRTRGAGGTRRAGGRSRRITPAYAGSWLPTPRHWRPPPDHPRVRGELGGRRVDHAAISGSPPRTRGAGSLTCGSKDPDLRFHSLPFAP